jgi:hypothetical protein
MTASRMPGIPAMRLHEIAGWHVTCADIPADSLVMPAGSAFTATLPRPANPNGSKAGGMFRQAGRMPRDEIMLPAREIPPECACCTWVACASGEMKLKFVNGHCWHAEDAVPWDYSAWYGQPAKD